MRFIRAAIITLLIVSGIYYLMTEDNAAEDSVENDILKLEQKEHLLKSKEVPKNRTAIPLEGDIYQWMDKSAKQLEEAFGKPLRKDPSAYGYKWWLYTDEQGRYIQFGMQNDQVKSIYALGDQLSLEPAEIGQTYQSLSEKFSFAREVTYSKDHSSYTFQLKDKELQARPLVKVTNDTFLQLYFDTFTDKLQAIRMLSADILLHHRPYEVKYRGELKDKPDITDEQWTSIEQGAEQQIFLISNIIRNKYEKSSLTWDDNVSKVAWRHSKDMAENNYFSHYGQNGDGLKKRLAREDVFYQSAGENIAAQYPDAPAAIHGWMNSKGHREALLNDDFTHLGAGVHRLYYTQNFLQRP